MKRKLLTISALISCLPFILAANATETRCGWLQNPTPGNSFLTDRHGTWIISAQGGYQAAGIDDNMPSINEREYVTTNGSYGYACACLRVVADRNQMRIVTIQSGRQLPLRTCRQDPNLPKTP
jgi:uncharacterized protein YqjF (DUF2071 family)